MKEYPSIPKVSLDRGFENVAGCYVFDKLDGSNVRFEWGGKKVGWSKFGTRTCLMDLNTPIFGHAIPIFMSTLSDKLAKMAVDERWEKLTVFCEFWGDKSFAGWKEVYNKQGDLYPEDTRYLTVIDLCPHKKCIVGPKDFIKLNENYDITMPDFLGQHNFNQELVSKVYNDDFDGVSFEGIVAKVGESHKLKMYKAKTKKWIDKIKENYTPEEAEKILQS